MAQISRRWIKPEVEEKVRRLLIECVARCKDKKAAANFVDVLLTKTEKLMIAKRVAIALMLVKGYTPQEIDDVLKVSLATIYTVQAWLDSRGAEYRSVLEGIAKDDLERYGEMRARRLEATSVLTLPRGGNWKETRHKQWEKVREATEPF